MDNQHSPKLNSAPEHALLNSVLAQVAEEPAPACFLAPP